jgi:hypothetical protein
MQVPGIGQAAVLAFVGDGIRSGNAMRRLAELLWTLLRDWTDYETRKFTRRRDMVKEAFAG